MSQRDVIDVVVPFYSVHSHISFGINQSVIYIFYKKLSQKCVVYFFPIRVQITGKILKKCHMTLVNNPPPKKPRKNNIQARFQNVLSENTNTAIERS